MRPLLITADTTLLDSVVGVAAAVRVQVDVAADVGSAVGRWSSAPLVLVDAASVPAIGALPRRSGLVVVSEALDDVGRWREVSACGAERIVELPADAAWLAERLSRATEPVVAAEVVAVLGASGGVGTSTLAAALAGHASGPDHPGILVDLDPGGGGLDLLLGIEQQPGARWEELASVGGRVDSHVLVDALPKVDDVRVLSWSTEAGLDPDLAAVTTVVESLAAGRGRVVLDAGRGVDLRAQALLPACARVVVVVPLRVRAVTAARRLLRQLPHGPSTTLVARGPAPGGVTARDLELALGHAVTAVLPTDRRRPEVEELGGGLPTGSPWRKVCDAIGTAAAPVAA